MKYQERVEKKFESFWMPAYTETSLIMMLFASGMILNACSLNDAFQTMKKQHNQLSAMALIRMLCDNCLYTYGLIIAHDKNAFLNAYWDNTLSKLKHDGNVMTAGFLKRELTKKYSKIEEFYNLGCTIVHPSRFYMQSSTQYTASDKTVFQIDHNHGNFSVNNFQQVEMALDYINNVFDDLLDLLVVEIKQNSPKSTKGFEYITNLGEYTRFIFLICDDGGYRLQYDRFFDRIRKPVDFDKRGKPVFLDAKQLIIKIRELYTNTTIKLDNIEKGSAGEFLDKQKDKSEVDSSI